MLFSPSNNGNYKGYSLEGIQEEPHLWLEFITEE